MKRIFTLLLLLLISSSSWTQVLKTTNLNLNPGGVVHDVAYDSYYDAYVVVGSFSTINGQSRNNLAFIDANTFAVLPQAPITGIDGVIRSVEVVNLTINHPTLGLGMRNYMYLGGNFTTINTQNRVSIARLISSHYYSQPPAGGIANYAVNTAWDAEFYYNAVLGPEYGVHAFHLMGDTLIAVGEFNNLGASYLTGDYHRKVIALDADNTTFLTKNLTFLNGIAPFGASGDEPLQGVEQLGDRLFLYGEDANVELINEYDLNGNFVQQIEFCSPNIATVLDFEPHPSSIDTILFALEGAQFGTGTYYITSYLNDGTNWNCPGVSSTNTMLNFPSMGQVNHIESYKDYVFNASSNALFTSKRNGTNTAPITSNISLNSNWYNSYPSISTQPCLKMKDDLLFFSSNALSSVNGSTRTGLAIFCLEPRDAEPFTSFDNTACEGDFSLYSIPQAQFADGYRWTYTGTGAMYRTVGSSTWLPLSTHTLSGANMNAIEVYFPIGATGGTLSVEPFSVCNTATDYQFAQGQSDVISVNPVPDITLAPTHTLNCYSDTTLIVAQSSVSTVNFSWLFNNGGGTSNNDTILITENNSMGFVGDYIVTVTNYLTGCVNRDTTYFSFDLTANQIDANLTTTTPPVWTCSTTSMTVSSNQTNYNVYWTNTAGTSFPDPFTITSVPNGVVYNLHGIQISNGCPTQDQFGAFSVNMVQAEGTLVGYNYANGGTPVDSLSCNNPSITIQCAVTAPFAANSTAQWLDGSGTPTGSDLLTLTEQDANGSNVIVRQFQTINNDNGCTDMFNVQVLSNFSLPSVGSLADQTLNCSQSEVLLTHPMNGSANMIEGWLDGTGTQTNADTLLVTSTGEYYYQVLNTVNGCSNTDTVSVVQTLDLLLDMPTDTLICPNQTVTIAPTVIGNTETPSYTWSTGSSNPSETGTGGVDTELIVTVSTPSGCSGTDTTLILITTPATISVTPYVACTDGSLQITNVIGGAGNNQYSIDGITWTDSTNFSGLPFGTYTVSVQDDLGCIYDTTALLDGTAQSVEMNFAASTYNEEGDTIILVNITDFTGLDSVAWNLPPTANVVYVSDSIAILSMATGGWYDVELIGYLDGNCEFSYVNPVFFGDHAPFFDDSTNFNGIQNYQVYPNPLNTAVSNTITVDIEFGKTQNYTILVTNTLGQPIPSMSITSVGEIVSHQLTFPTGTAAGTYRVHIIADYDARQEQITLY